MTNKEQLSFDDDLEVFSPGGKREAWACVIYGVVRDREKHSMQEVFDAIVETFNLPEYCRPHPFVGGCDAYDAVTTLNQALVKRNEYLQAWIFTTEVDCYCQIEPCIQQEKG